MFTHQLGLNAFPELAAPKLAAAGMRLLTGQRISHLEKQTWPSKAVLSV